MYSSPKHRGPSLPHQLWQRPSLRYSGLLVGWGLTTLLAGFELATAHPYTLLGLNPHLPAAGGGRALFIAGAIIVELLPPAMVMAIVCSYRRHKNVGDILSYMRGLPLLIAFFTCGGMTMIVLSADRGIGPPPHWSAADFGALAAAVSLMFAAYGFYSRFGLRSVADVAGVVMNEVVGHRPDVDGVYCMVHSDGTMHAFPPHPEPYPKGGLGDDTVCPGPPPPTSLYGRPVVLTTNGYCYDASEQRRKDTDHLGPHMSTRPHVGSLTN